MRTLFSFRIKIILSVLFILAFIFWQAIRYHQDKNLEFDDFLDDLEQPLIQVDQDVHQARVLVTVYYEALCPDSRSFFTRHLLPSYERAVGNVDVDLIPYGKAKTSRLTNGKYYFTCQHGEVECLANKIHACSIEYIKNKLLLLRYVTCMIDNPGTPDVIAERCGDMFSIEVDPILACATKVEGNTLLKKYGIITDALYPPMRFVPTVLLNKNHFNQALILKNLWREICRHFKDDMAGKCISDV